MCKNKYTHAERRQLQPEDEERLESEIPREVIQNNTECESFGEVEEAEHDPVCQPLNVILVARSLNSLEGQVSGECPTDEVRDRGGERIDEMEEGDKSNSANEGVCLWDLCALLKVDKDRVLGKLIKSTRQQHIRGQRRTFNRKKRSAYLLIQLGKVKVGLGLSLLENGVLLYFLRGRHLCIGPRETRQDGQRCK